jgi:hypothetical protein
MILITQSTAQNLSSYANLRPGRRMREEGAAQRRLELATHDRMTSLALIVRFPLTLSIRSTV